MTTQAATGPDAPPQSRTRKVFHGTCAEHPGARGFTNLMVTKVDGTIVLDPHAVGCRIELDETEAAALRDQLSEWLGMTASRPAWFVRSMGDHDTHRPATRFVHACCGAEFVPLRVGINGDRLSLPGYPPDPDQVCPACRTEHA